MSGHWLSFVPDHWSVAPLAHHFVERSESVSDQDFPPLSVTKNGVVPQLDTAAKTDNRDNRKLVKRGDFAINSRSDRKGSGGLSSLDGSVSVVYTVLTPRPSIEGRFAHHLLRSPAFQEEFYRWGSGIVADLWSTRYSAMKRIPLALPPLAEQQAIADYLDRETAQIDTLIEKQQRLVEVLRERRANLVRGAVLGAENPFAPSPESSWTGVGHHFTVTLGKMLDAGKDLRDGDELLPYIRAGNIQDNGLRLDDVNSMPYSASEAAHLNLLAGDLLVVEGGAVGTNVVITDDMPGWSFQKTVNRLRPIKDASSRWLGYVLRTYRDLGVIDIICNKSTIPHLTAEKLRALRVPATDADEQRRIVAYLDEQTAKIDTLIAKTERFIELSRERRSALITAAVTGQIDVRTEAA